METPAPAEMHLGDVDDALRQIAEELERSAYLEEHTEDEATRVVDAGTDVNQAVEEGNGKSSDVSEIAKKILDTVNHEDGVKWRESTFLALMRDFRDGKKVIVEDTVQDSDSSSKRD
jgi:pantothenate synthetase